MSETRQRFSFSQTAAQQPERQRFSFSQTALKKAPTLNEAMDKMFPHRGMIRDFSARNPTEKKPTLGQMGREFLVPGRGFTDEEIATEGETTRASLKNVGRWTAEMGLGLASLTHMGGNKLMQALPGYGKEEAERAAAAREELLGKIEPFISPKTAKDAAEMRFIDQVTLVGALVGKAGKVRTVKALVDSKTTKEATETLTELGIKKPSPDIVNAVLRISDEKQAQKFVDNLVAQAKSPKTPGTRFSFSQTAKEGAPTTPRVTPDTPPRSVDGSPVTPTRVPTPTQVPTPTAPTRFSFADTAKQAPTPAVRQTPTFEVPVSKVEAPKFTAVSAKDEIIKRYL